MRKAPLADGSAVEGTGSGRMMRGGSFYYNVASRLRADRRYSGDPRGSGDGIGFRLAR